MNAIDAVEGTVKKIIDQLHAIHTDNRMDDSEYVRNIKAAIEGAKNFVVANTEIVADPNAVSSALYDYAKALWLSSQKEDNTEDTATETDPEKNGYNEYYFDHLYQHGLYPL